MSNDSLLVHINFYEKRKQIKISKEQSYYIQT